MAIVFEGLSQCPLCEQVLDNSSEFIMTPPLTSNTKDALFIFSDAGIHVTCLNGHPQKESLLYQMQQSDEARDAANAVCIVDGKLITHPDDYLTTGMLTSDLHEPLVEFNFIILNRNNKYKWDKRNEFISLLKEFIKRGKWEPFGPFNYLEYLLKELT